MNKKTLLMIISVLVFCITIGYALLSRNLYITGTSHVDSNFYVRITNIRVKTKNSSYNSNLIEDEVITNSCSTTTAPSGCK